MLSGVQCLPPNVDPSRRNGPHGLRIGSLDVAERLFADKGYEATTLREIASGVQIQNPSLYKHFDSKLHIYEAVLDRAVRPLLDEFWDTEGEIEAGVLHLARHASVCQLILRETLSGGTHLRPLVAKRVVEAIERTREFLSESGRRRQPAAAVALRVLALCHVAAGYSASASFYAELTGVSLTSSAALAEQVKIVTAVSEALFAPAHAK